MVIFHSYVSLPEGSWLVVSNMAYIPPIVCGISMNIPYDWLLVWNMFFFPIILEMSSSQLTNSMIFQRGRLNHQPEKWAFRGISRGFQCDLTNANMVIYSNGMSWDQNPPKNVTV